MLENTTDNAVKGKVMPSLGNARNYISMMTARKEAIQNQQREQQQNERINDSLSLHQHGIATDNENLSKQYNKGSRMEEAAGMVSAFNGATGDYKKVIGDFINEHDDEQGSMYNAFYDYIQNGSITTGELADRTIDKVDSSYSYNLSPTSIEDSTTYDPMEGLGGNSTEVSEDTYNPFEGEIKGTDKELEDEDASWRENVIGGIVETALGIPKLAVRGGAYLGYGKDKLMGEDDTIAKANLNKTLNGIDETFEKITPGDENSLLRAGTNLTTDLGVTALMTMIPGAREAKVAEFLSKYKNIEKMIKAMGSFEKFAEKYPKWAKTIKTFLKGGKLGAEIEIINNALDGEFTSIEEGLEGGLFGVLTERGLNTKAAKNISTWMQTNGLMTTARMRNIVNKIKDFTTNATPERLANFMTKYGLTGSREAIQRRARKLYEGTMEIIDGIFSKVKGEFESKVTTETIDSLMNIIEEQIASKKVPASGYQKTLDRLKEIYNGENKYSASIMEEVKRLADKIIRGFKESGDLKAGYEGWVETRKILQKQLEEIGKPFGDIEMLNNIVQTSYGIMDSIGQKMAGDNFMNIATKAIPIALGIPAIKDIMKGDWSSIPADMVLPLISSNTWLRTHAGSLLNRMRGTTRDQVNTWLTSEGKEMLSKEATEEFMNVLRGDEGFKTWFKDFLANYLKDAAIIGETNVSEGIRGVGKNILGDIQTE